MRQTSGSTMSFLLDPPALVILGFVISRYVTDHGSRRWIAGAVVTVFLIVSGLLYLNVIPWWWGTWISGTDWMLNSGLDTTLQRSAGTDVLALVLFAAYPLWMHLGLMIGRRNALPR